MLVHPTARLTVMFDPARRLLLQALLCSLLAHALLLLEVSPHLKAFDEIPAGTMQAVLRPAPPALPAVAPPRRALPAAQGKPAPQITEKAIAVARRAPASPPVSLPARSPQPAPPQPTPPQPTPPQPAPSTPVVPPQSIAQQAGPGLPISVEASSTLATRGEQALANPPASSAQGAATTSTARASPAAPPDALREYRLALAVQARRFRRYPALARERGQEGTAEITISVTAALAAPQVGLATSSGHVELDTQALEMMRQAALAAPLPGGLRGRDFRVVLPVLFSLDDAP